MKYGNKKTEYDGHKFDSLAERDRYIQLKALEEQGVIQALRLQFPFLIIRGGRWANGRKYPPTKYIADFVYELDGEIIVEDVKGYKTHDYTLKKKLMMERYGIEIREVKK